MRNKEKKEKNKMKIYNRIFDYPLSKDGTKKERKLLGEFDIIKVIREDTYTSMRIGIKNGKKYLIEEHEVCGHNGGSRFTVDYIDD